MNKKSVTITIIICVLVIVIAYSFTRNSKNDAENATENLEVETSQNNTLEVNKEVAPEEPLVFDEPTTENPADQGNVRSQPAYLWSAKTAGDGTQNIGVDYVLVFEGKEAVQAQVEDGVCALESECENGPYIRNNNSHHRTYNLSTTTPFSIEVNGAIHSALLSEGVDKTTITFDELKETLPKLPTIFLTDNPAFKEAKTFVYLDIIGGAVTKIREPESIE